MDTCDDTTARTMARAFAANSLVLTDADDRAGWAEAAVFTALGAPVPDELLDFDVDTPLLRWADHDVPAVSLLDAIINPPRHRAKGCDRCAGSLRTGRVRRLWLPCGQSVVELQVDGLCHDVLNDCYRAVPDPGGPAGRALVWR